MPLRMAPPYEIGRENALVPPRHLSHGKIETHHGMNGYHERSQNNRKKKAGLFIGAPLAPRPLPAQCQPPVPAPQTPLAAIPQQREIRHQADIPVQQGKKKIGADCHDIPHQRRGHVRPNSAHFRQRGSHPRHPDTPYVHHRENGGANNRAQGHLFRSARNRASP